MRQGDTSPRSPRLLSQLSHDWSPQMCKIPQMTSTALVPTSRTHTAHVTVIKQYCRKPCWHNISTSSKCQTVKPSTFTGVPHLSVISLTPLNYPTVPGFPQSGHHVTE